MAFFWGFRQAEGPTAADEEESDKSMSEVNDEDEGDEDGSGEVCPQFCFLIAFFPVFGHTCYSLHIIILLAGR